jgi:site-specific DNA-methyltransferase (adenine-specific)
MATKTGSQKRIKFASGGTLWTPTGIFKPGAPDPILATPHGVLFNDDCLAILRQINDETIDTVFADPPFNIGKHYGKTVDDNRPDADYLEWYKEWTAECARVLKPGGSMFIYNLPKWNVLIGPHLQDIGLTFRHWIAVSIKLLLPIPGRLYPCHYSLLYYCKGRKPKTFRSIRTPIQVCRHCGGEIKDYGGHRNAMNPKGVNLTDVWEDIPPVRHWKFKSKKRSANQLSTKLLTRVIELSTVPGDVVLDPFGGAGTTFDVCETSCRNWIGTEIENCDVIIERLTSDELAQHKTTDHIED